MLRAFVQIVSLAGFNSFLLAHIGNVHCEGPDAEKSTGVAPVAEPKKVCHAEHTVEDEYSLHMPLDLKCDACRIVAYVLTEGFKNVSEKAKARSKTKQRRTFAEHQILEFVENTCSHKGYFKKYGLVVVNKTRRLSGRGLETYRNTGVWTGGLWPMRLSSMCTQYTGELGEWEVFHAWENGQYLEDFICRNEEMPHICPPLSQLLTAN
ncbi:hypothetical protein BaRGS_00017756 [Batillaria attramentaria]|uniref:DUF3456 domain-containing protein n=1 Tax=Batillaria attramentaria TaxID=370345 RepID=A0ABD0KV71_9CAEN